MKFGVWMNITGVWINEMAFDVWRLDKRRLAFGFWINITGVWRLDNG